jgi:DNA-binding transcriptional MerR regulator
VFGKPIIPGQRAPGERPGQRTCANKQAEQGDTAKPSCSRRRARVTEFEHFGAAALATGQDHARGGHDVFTIRDLAKEFGVSARTLRFYEEKGLIDPARRGEQRLYTRRDRARLAYVLAGKTVGFSLEEVREMLDLYDLGDGQVTQLKVALAKFGERIERLERQKTDIDRVVAELTRASDVMKAKLAARERAGE